MYKLKKTDTDIFGLLHDFSTEPELSDHLEIDQNLITEDVSIRLKKFVVGGDFSTNNKESVKPFIKDWMKLFVEIGVSRDGWENSSTKFLLDHMSKNGRYVGIDIGNREFVKAHDSRVEIIRGDSKDVEENILKINLNEDEYIDLLHIDGNHSVDYVKREWDYAKYVRPAGGIIILHDINFHSGPWCLVRSVDPNLFDIHLLSPNDLGVAVLVRK